MLRCVEDREVPFTMVEELALTGRKTTYDIDPTFVAVCVPGTIRIQAVSLDVPATWGACVDGSVGIIEIQDSLFGKAYDSLQSWLHFLPQRRRPINAIVSLRGIRRGFEGATFTPATYAMKVANDRFYAKAREI
jgi:hypothetical protein